MNYSSTIEFKSEVDPTIVYQLVKMSHARRIDLNTTASGVIAKLSDIDSQIEAVDNEIKRASDIARISPCSCGPDCEKATIPEELLPNIEDRHLKVTGICPVPGCSCRRPQPDPTIGGYEKFLELQQTRQNIIFTELYPVYIRWGVSSMSGLTIDGVEADIDMLIRKGPEMLIGELGRRIQKTINLSPEEVLGFKLPSTFGEQSDGQTSGTSAPTAKP